MRYSRYLRCGALSLFCPQLTAIFGSPGSDSYRPVSIQFLPGPGDGPAIKRSEKERHEGSGLLSVSVIGFAEVGTHPLFLHAELDPQHEEDEREDDEAAHLGDRNRHAEETRENSGVDGMTRQGIGTGGDQFVALLDGDGAAPVAAQVFACPDSEEDPGAGDASSQPEGPKASRPELDVEPRQWDARSGEEDDGNQEDEDAEDARGRRLKTLRGFGVDGFDLPVNKKGDPYDGKEGFVEPKHVDLRR